MRGVAIPPRHSGAAGNIAYGVAIAVVMATLYSALVLVLALLRGSTDYPQYGLTTWTVIRTYYAVAVPAGVVCGALRPLGRWRAGAVFLGWIAGAIAYGGIGLVMSGPSGKTLVLALVLGLAGAAVGYQTWERPESSAPPT